MKYLASSDFISKLHNSRNILLDIMEYRGYDVDDYRNSSINEINIQYLNNQLDMLLENSETSKKIYVKYHLSTKVKPSHIYEYIDDLYNLEQILSKKDDLIILIKDKPNDGLMTCMNTIFNTEKIYFNIFNIHNLLFNILEHNLVPSHKILNADTVEEVMVKYNITKMDQFPEISRFDPVAQAIGLRPGQLCEISRPSITAVTTKYYRLCY